MQQSASQGALDGDDAERTAGGPPTCFRIVRHAWIDRLRRNRTRREDDLVDWPDEGFDDRLIEAIAVRQAFATLDAPCRKVVTCVDVEGLSYRENRPNGSAFPSARS